MIGLHDKSQKKKRVIKGSFENILRRQNKQYLK
jgi:hypothetical protein